MIQMRMMTCYDITSGQDRPRISVGSEQYSFHNNLIFISFS